MSDETNQLPQWARDQITEANNEAAKYRTQRNEARETVRAELETEYEQKLAEVQGQLDAAQMDSVKLQAALAAGVPGERAAKVAELLKGTTEDEVTAHAAEVVQLLGTGTAKREPATDPSQGKGSDILPGSGDVLADTLRFR